MDLWKFGFHRKRFTFSGAFELSRKYIVYGVPSQNPPVSKKCFLTDKIVWCCVGNKTQYQQYRQTQFIFPDFFFNFLRGQASVVYEECAETSMSEYGNFSRPKLPAKLAHIFK